MIDKATENLKNSNPSGLDRRLLLPSVEAKAASEQEETQGQQLFKSINQMTATLSDKNDIIIDQLVELNATQKRILSEGGGGGKENMLQTLLALPKRAAGSVVKSGKSALQAGTNLLMSPLNLAKGAISGVGSAIASPFRGVGNAVGNLFQSKNLKALTEINRDQLTEQTAIREAAEDIAVKVEEIAGMMQQEFKIRRRGRLDELEAKRDARSGPGLIGGSALAASTAGGAEDDGEGFVSTLAKTLGFITGGKFALGAAGVGGAAVGAAGVAGVASRRTLTQKFTDLFRSKPLAPAAGNLNVPNPATKVTGGSTASRFSGARGLGAVGVALSSILGLTDRDYQDAGYSPLDRGGLGLVEGTLGLGDMIANTTNSALNLVNPLSNNFFSTNADTAGMFKDFATSETGKKIFQFTYGSNRPDQAKVMDQTYFSKEEANAAAEKANINDYVIKPIEVDIGEQGVSAVVPAFKIEKVDQKVRRMMDINISPESSPLSGSDFLTARDKAQDLSERSGVEFGVEKIINPQPFDDSVLGYQIKRKEAIIPALQAGVDNAGTNINVTPITDNRTSNSTTNNNTMISKMNLSSVDQTNKVVPI